MSKLKDEYNEFMKDLKSNIKNKEDFDYVITRFSTFFDKVLDEMERITTYKEEEISKMEKKQAELNLKMDKMQEILDNIESDIYDEEGFDFEIVCPYCDYEFVIDVDEERTEVTCPECNNTIELDWTGNLDDSEVGCSGNCSSCQGCDEEEKDDKNEDDM